MGNTQDQRGYKHDLCIKNNLGNTQNLCKTENLGITQLNTGHE